MAVCLRLLFLSYESFWDDEVITIRDSLKPVAQIVGQRWDPHPPLYYLVLHYWLRLGHSEAFIRLPSVVFGVISVLLIYRLSLRLAGPPVAWFTAVLLAVSPLAIWYSQEARMYALVVMWALAATYCWVCWLQNNGQRWRYGVGYVVFTTFGLYTHYSMLMVVVAQNMYTIALFMARPDGRPTLPWHYWFGSQFLIVLFYLPWLPQLPTHWALIRQSTDYPLWVLSTTPVIGVMAAAAVLAFAGCVLWLSGRMTLPASGERLLIMALTAGAVLIYVGWLALAMSDRMTTLKRQTFVLFPFFCVLLFWLLAKQTPKWRYGAILLLGVSLAAALVNGATLQKPPWREAVVFIETQVQSEDAIVLNPVWMDTVFQYYQQNHSPATVKPVRHEEFSRLPEEYETVWLITNTRFERWEDPEQEVRTWLSAHYELASKHQFGELEILQLSLPCRQRCVGLCVVAWSGLRHNQRLANQERIRVLDVIGGDDGLDGGVELAGDAVECITLLHHVSLGGHGRSAFFPPFTASTGAVAARTIAAGHGNDRQVLGIVFGRCCILIGRCVSRTGFIKSSRAAVAAHHRRYNTVKNQRLRQRNPDDDYQQDHGQNAKLEVLHPPPPGSAFITHSCQTRVYQLFYSWRWRGRHYVVCWFIFCRILFTHGTTSCPSRDG